MPPGDTPFAGTGPLSGESALSRFDRDVLAQPGPRYVVLFGTNDIGQAASIASIILPSEEVSMRKLEQGYRPITAHAYGEGLTIYGGTPTPAASTAPEPRWRGGSVRSGARRSSA